LHGVALVSDESPPSQPRFRGLRFQITVFYWGAWKDLSQWEACEDPPIQVSTSMADIMHCPGKKGVDVSRIIEKQLARFGMSCSGVTAGIGDGGGESEGHQGVHAYFENLNPGYVRRRCIPHIPGEPVMWPFKSLVSTIEPWQPTCPTASLGVAPESWQLKTLEMVAWGSSKMGLRHARMSSAAAPLPSVTLGLRPT